MILFVASAVSTFCISMYVAHYRLMGAIFESKWSFAIVYPVVIGISVWLIILSFIVTSLQPYDYAFNFMSHIYSSLGAEVFLGAFAGLFGQQWLKATERRNQHDPKTTEHGIAAKTARNQSIVVAVLIVAALLVQDSTRILELLKGVETPVFSVQFNALPNEHHRSSVRLHTPSYTQGAARAASQRDHPAVPAGLLTGLKGSVNRDDAMISKLVKPHIEATATELKSLRERRTSSASTASQTETSKEMERIRTLEEKLGELRGSSVEQDGGSLLPDAAIAIIEDYVSPLGACLGGLETDLKHEFFLLTQISAFAESVWSINREVQKRLDDLKGETVANLDHELRKINRSGSEFIYKKQDGDFAEQIVLESPGVYSANSKSLFASAVALALQVYHISDRLGAPCENLDMRDKERLANLKKNAEKLADEFSIHRPYLPLGRVDELTQVKGLGFRN